MKKHICPVGVFTEKLGGKWTLYIIYNLQNRTLRFGELAARIDGISRKVLSDALKQMEIDGLVTRTSFNEIPPRVEYSLTTAAKELTNVFKELEIWANRHFSK
jgi:DNA-binding HxlR family transcriptional regulator